MAAATRYLPPIILAKTHRQRGDNGRFDTATLSPVDTVIWRTGRV